MARLVDISNPAFSDRLTNLLDRAELDRDEIARHAGISPRTLSNWENGRVTRARESELRCLARALGISYTNLLGLESAHENAVALGREKRFPLYLLALGGSLALLAFHVRWETTRNRYEFDTVLPLTGPSDFNVQFVDLDGEGQMECVQNTQEGKFITVSRLDRSNPEHWRQVIYFQHPYQEELKLPQFAFDIDGNGAKDLFIVCKEKDSIWVEVRDLSERVLTSFNGASGAHVKSPTGIWDGRLFVEDVYRDTETGEPMVLMRTNTGYDHYPRDIRSLFLSDGRVAWVFPAGTFLSHCRPSDLDGDGKLEFLIAGQATGNKGNENGFDDSHAYLIALGHKGKLKWSLSLGETSFVFPKILKDGTNERKRIFVVVENRRPSNPTSPFALLIDGSTGGVLDSLGPVTPVTNDPMAVPTKEANSWDVFCATPHGLLRQYRVANDRIQIVRDVRLSRTALFLDENMVRERNQEIVVAYSGSSLFLMDRRLQRLAETSLTGLPMVRYVASFEEPGGGPFLAIATAGGQMLIGRLLRINPNRKRALFGFGYLVLGLWGGFLLDSTLRKRRVEDSVRNLEIMRA